MSLGGGEVLFPGEGYFCGVGDGRRVFGKGFRGVFSLGISELVLLPSV